MIWVFYHSLEQLPNHVYIDIQLLLPTEPKNYEKCQQLLFYNPHFGVI